MKTASEIKEFGMTESEDFFVVQDFGGSIEISGPAIIWDFPETECLKFKTFIKRGNKKINCTLSLERNEDYVYRPVCIQLFLLEERVEPAYTITSKNRGIFGWEKSFKAALEIALDCKDVICIEKQDGFGVAERWVPPKTKSGKWIKVKIPESEKYERSPKPNKF